MKTLAKHQFILCILLCILANVNSLYSQESVFQRIAIPAISEAIDLSVGGESVVASFCTDFNRETPKLHSTNFNHVQSSDERCVYIGNNPPITMQQALDQGYLGIEVNGYKSVKIKNLNKTSESIKMQSRETMIVGDTPNDKKGLYNGDLTTPENVAEQDGFQRNFWEDQSHHRSLINLKYLNEADINDKTAFREAVKKYQIDNNITPAQGDFGPITKENLDVNTSLKKYLPEQYQSLSTQDAIKKFQETYSITPGTKLKPTDILDNITLLELLKLESINASVFNHSAGFSFLRNKTEGTVLNEVFDILYNKTFTENDGDVTHVLTPSLKETGSDFEYLKIRRKDGDGFSVIDEGDVTNDKLLLFDKQYQTKVAQATNQSSKVIHFGMVSNGSMKVQLGSTNLPLSVTSGTENEITSQIITGITPNINSFPDNANIIISRDDLVRRFFKNNDAGSIFLTKTDFSADAKWINPQKFMEDLKTAFPTKKFTLGGDLEKDVSSLNGMKPVQSTADITAFTAPASLDVQYDLIKKVSDECREDGIKVVNLDNVAPPTDLIKLDNTDILFIAGNKDEAFDTYLAKVAGYYDLEDKVLVTFSCFKSGNDAVNSSLIKLTNARAVIYFPTEIQPDAVQGTLLKILETVKNLTDSKDIKSLLDEAIDKASQEETNSIQKNRILELKKYIIQTSFIFTNKYNLTC